MRIYEPRLESMGRVDTNVPDTLQGVARGLTAIGHAVEKREMLDKNKRLGIEKNNAALELVKLKREMKDNLDFDGSTQTYTFKGQEIDPTSYFDDRFSQITSNLSSMGDRGMEAAAGLKINFVDFSLNQQAQNRYFGYSKYFEDSSAIKNDSIQAGDMTIEEALLSDAQLVDGFEDMSSEETIGLLAASSARYTVSGAMGDLERDPQLAIDNYQNGVYRGYSQDERVDGIIHKAIGGYLKGELGSLVNDAQSAMTQAMRVTSDTSAIAQAKQFGMEEEAVAAQAAVSLANDTYRMFSGVDAKTGEGATLPETAITIKNLKAKARTMNNQEGAELLEKISFYEKHQNAKVSQVQNTPEVALIQEGVVEQQIPLNAFDQFVAERNRIIDAAEERWGIPVSTFLGTHKDEFVAGVKGMRPEERAPFVWNMTSRLNPENKRRMAGELVDTFPQAAMLVSRIPDGGQASAELSKLGYELMTTPPSDVNFDENMARATYSEMMRGVQVGDYQLRDVVFQSAVNVYKNRVASGDKGYSTAAFSPDKFKEVVAELSSDNLSLGDTKTIGFFNADGSRPNPVNVENAWDDIVEDGKLQLYYKDANGNLLPGDFSGELNSALKVPAGENGKYYLKREGSDQFFLDHNGEPYVLDMPAEMEAYQMSTGDALEVMIKGLF